MKGESTKVKVEVTGLEGLNRRIPVRIVNNSPANINLAGGNGQILMISSGETISGRWSREITATGITSGAYSVMAEFPEPEIKDFSMFPKLDLPASLFRQTEFPLVWQPQLMALYGDFVRGAGILMDIKDFNLPKKYRYDPEKETVARGSSGDFNNRRKKAAGDAAGTKEKTDSTRYKGRDELKGTVGFRVYYTPKDKNGCYWIVTDWNFWKCDEYYKNRWRINRELDDILRFNNIQVDVEGNIEMEGEVETGGLETSAEIGVSIPIPGVDAGVGVSWSPPSTAALRAKGTLKGSAKGYLDGKTLVVYIYKDTYHVERAYVNYYFRIIQKYCNDQPAGLPIYETTMLERWEKYNEVVTLADAFLVTEGIPTGPGTVHQRVETLAENQHVRTDVNGIDPKTPGEGEDPSGYFEGVKK